MKKKDHKNPNDKVLPFQSARHKKDQSSSSESKIEKTYLHAEPAHPEIVQKMVVPSEDSARNIYDDLLSLSLEDLINLVRKNIEQVQERTQRIDFYLEEISMTKAMENFNKKRVTEEE